MNWRSTPSRYGSIPILLHWLTVLLIVGVYAAMDLKGLTPRGSPGRANMAMWHYALGLTIFALVWLRVIARVSGTTPGIDPPSPVWQDRTATLVHWLLYAFMIVMPVLGWLTVSAKGDPVVLFGVGLPSLVAKDDALAKSFKTVHEGLATVGYYIIGLHVVAALFHHYVRRDNTLLRMWPASADAVARTPRP